jgi:hypothetical protein
MARTERIVEDTSIIIPDDPHGHVAEAVQALNTLAAIDQQTTDNALAVARQFGYDGTLTVGALEDEIRFYQRRTVEACLELGKRLLILKELTPHGEFKERVKLLGIEYTTATRFMSATYKFSNVGSNQLLKAAGTQTKLLELLVLDDGEIEALESGESVRGVTLDAIETMSVSELKKALREARKESEAAESIIRKKDEKLNELDRQLEKQRLTPKQEPVEEQRMPGEFQLMRLQEYSRDLTVKITATLNSEIVKLYNEFGGQPPKHIELAARQAVGLVITSAYGVAENMGFEPITEPELADDEPGKADAEAFMAYQAAQAGA